MDNDDFKFLLGFVATAAILGATISCCGWSISHYYTSVSTEAIKAGLVQDSVQGQHGVFWTKKAGE